MAADPCDPSAVYTVFRRGDPVESLCTGCSRRKAQLGRGVLRQRSAVYLPSRIKHDLFRIQRHVLPERFPAGCTLLPAGPDRRKFLDRRRYPYRLELHTVVHFQH